MSDTEKLQGDERGGVVEELIGADGTDAHWDVVGLVAETVLQSPFLSWLRTDALQQITSSSDLVSLKAGGSLFDEGGVANGVFVLLRGRIAITRSDRDVTRSLGAGSLLDGSPVLGRRTTSAWAEEDSLALRIPNGLYAILCSYEPSLCGRLRRSSWGIRDMESDAARRDTQARVREALRLRRALSSIGARR